MYLFMQNFEMYHEEATLFTMHDLVHDLATLLLGNQIMDQSKTRQCYGMQQLPICAAH